MLVSRSRQSIRIDKEVGKEDRVGEGTFAESKIYGGETCFSQQSQDCC